MKKLIFLFGFSFLTLCMSAQVKPNDFPVDNTPSNSDAFYTQEGDNARKIFLSTLKNFYGVRVNESQLLYTPSANNNSTNLNQIVTGADDNIYLIDVDGDALRLNANEMKVEGGLFIPDTLLLYGSNPNMDSIRILVPRTTVTGSSGSGSLAIGKSFNFISSQTAVEITVSGNGGEVTVVTNLNMANLDPTQVENLATRLMEESASKQIFNDSLTITRQVHQELVVSGDTLIVPFLLPLSDIEEKLFVKRPGYICTHNLDYTIANDANGNRSKLVFLVEADNELFTVISK